jgi:uncharacterized protein YhfF
MHLHPSVTTMWRSYRALQGPSSDLPTEPPPAWHFCDNQVDADECARLALAGRKRATAHSLWEFKASGEPLPRVGDLYIVTNWAGEAQCIRRTTAVETLPFHAITEAHAAAEGEGDGTLAWWRGAHWAYYQRELGGSGVVATPDMLIVFEHFERVFPLPEATPTSD